MCIAGCSRPEPPRTVGPGPTDCTLGCPLVRNFIIVYGDPGAHGHNQGRNFILAAQTHEREVRANTFPGVPTFNATDTLNVVHISLATDIIAQINVGNVMYLAYFGHSGPIGGPSGGPGALFINDGAVPNGNLTNRASVNDLSPTAIPASKFRSDGQVRMFGCRGGFGRDPIARQLADQLRIPVFGYTNPGGTLFTDDVSLGHGNRAVTQADAVLIGSNGKPVPRKLPNNAANVWLVPANGIPTFQRF